MAGSHLGGAILVARQAIVDTKKDENIGSALDDSKNSNSAKTVLATLAPIAVVALLWFIVFLVLRKAIPRKYSPRSYLGSLPPHERSPQMPTGLLNWFGRFWSVSDTHVLNHHTLDGYLFLRFLKISIVCCLVGCLITWPILFPINITGGGGQQQLDILTIGNVQKNYWRYLAHAGCAYLFFGFIMFMITRESIFYINLRQAYLLSPLYAQRISSRTVLFSSVPQPYLNETALRAVFGPHVKQIWIPTDTKDLDDLVEERDKVAFRLETAETKLVRAANAARLKAIKKGQSGADNSALESGSVASRWLTPKQRPTHRLKPIIGKKVDTINWSRAELPSLISRVEHEQNRHRAREANLINAAFVEFDSLAEAQAAYQSLTHHQPLHMAPRYTGMVPEEIIWSNLRIKWWARIIRSTIAIAAAVALIIFWSIPVAFVASISNINYLIELLPFLEFIRKIPDVLLGLVTGLLPVVLLIILIALVPVILRALARLGGDPTLSAVELTVQNTFFAFQVIQVFLVATLGSAASSAVGVIADDPSSITTMLSTQIPKASNFYLAFFIVQGLAVVASKLVGLIGLIILFVLGKLFDNTPRKQFRRWTKLAGLGWGTVFPVHTNFLVIAICYACIQPLVLGFAAVGMWLFYFVYRYNILFVYDIHIDTKGLVYPRALQQVFVGLYLAELCLIGLFAIKASELGGLIALILMIILLVTTAIYQKSLNSALSPLLRYLPKTLVAEERRLLEVEGPTNGSDDKGLEPAPHAKPSMITKFLRPDLYTDYATMRRLAPRDSRNVTYAQHIAHNAYYPPTVNAPTPLLWIPRDPMGISRQEVHETGKSIAITDEGAQLDEKNRIVWDKVTARPPIYEEKVYY